LNFQVQVPGQLRGTCLLGGFALRSEGQVPAFCGPGPVQLKGCCCLARPAGCQCRGDVTVGRTSGVFAESGWPRNAGRGQSTGLFVFSPPSPRARSEGLGAAERPCTLTPRQNQADDARWYQGTTPPQVTVNGTRLSAYFTFGKVGAAACARAWICLPWVRSCSALQGGL
jgi:hypothetical protein